MPSVACNDKDGAVSDEDYKSLERPVTTTSAGATMPPVHPNPSAAVGEQRHHEHHQIEFQKSVEGTGDRISSKSPSVHSDVEVLQVRVLELEAAKDAAEQEQQRLAKEVIRLEEEKNVAVKCMQEDAAKARRQLEREVVLLNRQCEKLKDENESLQGLLDVDGGSKSSSGGSTVVAKLAEASVPVSQSSEHNEPARTKVSGIRRHASYDAALSVSDDTHSSDLEESFCVLGADECNQGLSERTTGSPAAYKQELDKLYSEIEKLRTKSAQLQVGNAYVSHKHSVTLCVPQLLFSIISTLPVHNLYIHERTYVHS